MPLFVPIIVGLQIIKLQTDRPPLVRLCKLELMPRLLNITWLDELKLSNSNFKSQVIKCGINASIAGAIFLIAVYWGGEIVSFIAGICDVMAEFLGYIDLVVRVLEIVGGLHFSIHVIVYTVFVWSYCVWWKIGSHSTCESIQLKSFGYMSAAFCISYFVCLTGSSYQPGMIKAVEYLVGVVICFMYAASPIGFNDKKSKLEASQ